MVKKNNASQKLPRIISASAVWKYPKLLWNVGLKEIIFAGQEQRHRCR